MVELGVKVGNKGQILIQKSSDKYGVRGGANRNRADGLRPLIKGRPSPDEIIDRPKKHVEAIKEGFPAQT